MDCTAEFLAHQQAVHREAQRIASISAFKLFRTRTQRGGMRLHRSLQLALVMRSARELILSSAQVPEQQVVSPPPSPPRESRKRRSCGPITADLVPSKKACLGQETPEPQPQGGPFPGLAEVLQRLLSSGPPPMPGGCGSTVNGHLPVVNTRPVEAF
ncbi:immediate early response gene 2 protein [Bombina bombina]|uniref:immediate early response gene 2 protein n=1 Tax=Bombina bombina TaxID=8345 RepID=UPI00235AA249|nr:immediate early response gene 2 protein [Bombina bombina]